MTAPLSPTIRRLLRDAHNAARHNLPLHYHRDGFFDPRQVTRPRVHPFQTVRAAERRGLVQTTGAGHWRKLWITGLGLGAALADRRRKGS